MLLIKYDGKTNVCDVIKHFSWCSMNGQGGNNEDGWYYIEQNRLKYTRELPSSPHVVYNSSNVTAWDSYRISTLPIEIRTLCHKYISGDRFPTTSVLGMCCWDRTTEGDDFWSLVSNNQFHKAFDYLAKHNILTNTKTNDHETRLQKETSSCSRGAEPKGCIISCKKSCATVTSGHLEYRGGIRG